MTQSGQAHNWLCVRRTHEFLKLIIRTQQPSIRADLCTIDSSKIIRPGMLRVIAPIIGLGEELDFITTATSIVAMFVCAACIGGVPR